MLLLEVMPNRGYSVQGALRKALKKSLYKLGIRPPSRIPPPIYPTGLVAASLPHSLGISENPHSQGLVAASLPQIPANETQPLDVDIDGVSDCSNEVSDCTSEHTVLGDGDELEDKHEDET